MKGKGRDALDFHDLGSKQLIFLNFRCMDKGFRWFGNLHPTLPNFSDDITTSPTVSLDFERDVGLPTCRVRRTDSLAMSCFYS